MDKFPLQSNGRPYSRREKAREHLHRSRCSLSFDRANGIGCFPQLAIFFSAVAQLLAAPRIYRIPCTLAPLIRTVVKIKRKQKGEEERRRVLSFRRLRNAREPASKRRRGVRSALRYRDIREVSRSSSAPRAGREKGRELTLKFTSTVTK